MLLAGYGSSDDETPPAPSTSGTSKRPALPAVAAAEADDEDSDDEKLEAQARTDAFGLNGVNGSASHARKEDAKTVVASAPDVLREVSCSRTDIVKRVQDLMTRIRIIRHQLSLLDPLIRSSTSTSRTMI